MVMTLECDNYGVNIGVRGVSTGVAGVSEVGGRLAVRGDRCVAKDISSKLGNNRLRNMTSLLLSLYLSIYLSCSLSLLQFFTLNANLFMGDDRSETNTERRPYCPLPREHN